MNFLVQAIIYIALTAYDYFRSSGRGPQSFDQLALPKVNQGDPIPVVFGTVGIASPTIIYAQPPYVVMSGGIAHYEGQIWFALCHGPFVQAEDGLVNVDCPNLVQAGYGESGQQWYKQSDFSYLGNNIVTDEEIGKQTGIGDGAFRTLLCRVYDGDAAQVLAAPPGFAGNWPSLRNVIVFVGGINADHDTWSAQPDFPPISFLVARLPHNLTYSGADDQYKIKGGFNFLDGTATMVGGWNANPAEILYEILTNQVWGLALPSSMIDIPSFVAAGEYLHTTDELGLSLLFDKQETAESMIRTVLEHIEAALFADFANAGKLTLKLIRSGEASALTLDQSNVISLDEFSRPAWFDLVNEVKVVYAAGREVVDADGFCTSWSYADEVAVAQDPAMFSLQGGFVSARRSYPGVNYSVNANEIAARDLKELSTPLAKVRLTVNREAYALNPGSVVTLNWEPLGITGLRLRVINPDRGTLENGRITLDCIEDIFGLGTAIFADPPATEWSPSTTPAEGWGADWGNNWGGS